MIPQIVCLSIDELQKVREIAHLTWPNTFKGILSPAQIAYMLEWMYNLETLTQQHQNGQRFYAIKANEHFQGFAAIELNHPQEGQTKLHKLYVLPDQQGKGFGKMLLDCVVEKLKNARIETLVLNVNRFNSAVKFYEKYGFSIIKEEVIDIGGGFIMDDFVMKLEL
jgi:ribosomal protein S18 acetylase RimI-like enzyme